MIVPTKEAVEARNYIEAINFKPIINRVIKEKGWLREEAEEIVELYKRFLFVQWRHDGKHYLVPTPDIDEIWHAHILYTKEYHEMSQHVFGRYLHHQPEEAMSIADTVNAPDLNQGFELTQQLYFKEFAEYIPDIRAYHPLGRPVVAAIKLFRKATAKIKAQPHKTGISEAAEEVTSKI